jgi:hypothetical protein
MTTTSVGPVYTASSFTQSIGVNTHLDWQNPGSGYANVAVVEASLAYLGVTHVRDGVPYTYWTLPEYEAIAATGVKFDIVTSGPTIDIASDLSLIDQLATAVPGSVAAVEGANEYNQNSYMYDGVSSLNNPAWAQLFGPALYAAVKADPALSGVSVIAAAMTNSSPSALQAEGNLSSFVDSSNWHVYYGQGDQPGANLASAIAVAKSTAPGDPVTITETGYYTAVQAMDWGGGGVMPVVQAILTVNALLDAFKDGAQTTYLYELMDNIENPSSTDLEDSFGLFYADGTPKPAAIAIHDLTTILADTGATAATFQPGTLNATITGLPTTGNSMVLEKSNGAYDIIVWNEPTIWNESTMSEVTPASTPITVNLGATYSLVEVFDPQAGSTPIETLTDASSVALPLGADQYIIELEPLPAPQTYSPGAVGGTIDSQGADTVVVGSGALTVDATGPTIDVVGGAGALTYSGTATATITGGAGSMNITLSASGSTVTAGAGGMTVLDLVGGNTIDGYPAYAGNGITVTTTTGNDTITTGVANNTITLGAGNDTVIANGVTSITGSTGNDTITANGAWTTIVTGTGASVVTMNGIGVVTTNGRDTVTTMSGLTLAADGPSTQITTGAGFVWFSGDGGATITGGVGGGYFNMTQLTAAAITTGVGATDTVLFGAAGGALVSQGTDTVTVGAGAATVTASGPSIRITGGAGALTYSGTAKAGITGGSGAMNLTVSGNNSTVTGGAGAMNVTLSATHATIIGGAGGMTIRDLVGGNTIEGIAGNAQNGINVTTTTGNDTIITSSWASNVINLGAGNDTVTVNGSSTVTGSTGNDTINVNGGGSNTIVTGTGTSTVTMKTAGYVTTNGHDTVTTTSWLSLTANGSATTLTGGAGLIWFGGTGGTATITGGAGGGSFNLSHLTGGGTVTTATGASDSITLGNGGGTVNAHGSDYVGLGSGAATISALAGTTTVQGSSGRMNFIEGAARATVTAGSGAATFTITNGHAGGTLTINDFVPGSDTINLVGYLSGNVHTQISGGATHITLSDNTVITLAGFTNASWHPTLTS